MELSHFMASRLGKNWKGVGQVWRVPVSDKPIFYFVVYFLSWCCERLSPSPELKTAGFFQHANRFCERGQSSWNRCCFRSAPFKTSDRRAPGASLPSCFPDKRRGYAATGPCGMVNLLLRKLLQYISMKCIVFKFRSTMVATCVLCRPPLSAYVLKFLTPFPSLKNKQCT